MKLRDLKEGIDIFLKYVSGSESLGGADHDVIYFFSGTKDRLSKISEVDRNRLIELGFILDDEAGWKHFA